MKLRKKKSIWLSPNNDASIIAIDQRYLPHLYCEYEITSLDQAVYAIQDMVVRGAPLIGVTAAYGMYLASLEVPSKALVLDYFETVYQKLYDSRPTAINLKWALDEQMKVIKNTHASKLSHALLDKAQSISLNDESTTLSLGEYGAEVLEKLYAEKQRPLNILTHCNAGRLATVSLGTATAPIYLAHEQGIPLQVWVDETRPRNQGANLTTWELKDAGVPHQLIVDNAGGYLMQEGLVDVVIVGSDRTCANGDVCNKIGTYLKALAAKENNVPFFVALPTNTIDWKCPNGSNVPIEVRSEKEITHLFGKAEDGTNGCFQICPDETKAHNPAFDITPAKYISGLITEKGIFEASKEGLGTLKDKL